MATSAAFWDKVAAKYDRKTVKGPNYAARIERAAEWTSPRAVVLDVGCAGGQITLDQAPNVATIVGIDVSPKLIDIAEARRAELGVANASFKVATPDDPLLKEASFNAITAYSMLHLVEDQAATLRRFHALLKPGGKLIAEIPFKQDISLGFRILIKLMTLIGKAPVVSLYSASANEAMLRDAGFKIEEIKAYNPKSMNHSVLATKR